MFRELFLSCIARLIVWILVWLERCTRLFGLRLCPINMASVLKGLPPEVVAEAHCPEIAEPFRRIVEDVEKSTWVDLMDRCLFKVQWRGILETRARCKQAVMQYPEVLKTEIRRPIFLIGLPRSGTTLLQRLMACDDRFFSPMMWEVMTPHPDVRDDGVTMEPPGRPRDWRNTKRCKTAVSRLRMINIAIDGIKRTHEMDPENAEECYSIMIRSCYGYHELVPDPDHVRWDDWFHNVTQEHMKTVYDFHKQQLQLIAHNGLDGLTYLLKANIHLLGLEALMDTYPDARFVFSFRPLTELVPSLTSHNWALHRNRYKPDDKYGLRNLRVLATLANRYVKVSEKFDNLQKHPFYVYQYKDIMKDPMATVRGIYAHLGEELTPEVEGRMLDYLRQHPQHYRGKHSHGMAEYNLTEGMLMDECRPYIEYFMAKGVPIEDLI